MTQRTELRSAEPRRNYGVDFLRILSMFYVLILHTLGNGGILNAARPGTHSHMAAWFLEIWAFCAVDIFALISGYVGYRENDAGADWSGYLTLWLQVVFYGLLGTAVFDLLRPELVSGRDYLISAMPLTNNLYWYFSAYTGVFLIQPLLNGAVRNLPASRLKGLFFLILLAFPLLSLITDVFALQDGYSFAWLALLYLLGAIVKKCGIGEALSAGKALLGVIVLAAFTWIWQVLGPSIPLLQGLCGRLWLASYLSPTVAGMAVLHLIGGAKLRIPNRVRRVIGFASPGAFAAYLLNVHRFVWDALSGRFSPYGTQRVLSVIGVTLGFSAAFLIVSILIDFLRQRLFALLRIRAGLRALQAGIERRFRLAGDDE